ncbi:thiol reductant ABC exporter subunit CydC [Salinifilum aidingensis]
MSPLGALPRLSTSARRALVLGGALAAAQAAALVVQAWALASALAAVVTGAAAPAEVTAHLVVLAAAIAARAAIGWATEAVSARAAAGAKAELRRNLVDAAVRRGPEWVDRRGRAELSTVATRGLDALDAYFTRYLPELITAGVVPPAIGAWILLHDGISALVLVLTVPLIPLFGWLVGRYTEHRTSRAARAVERLSAQLLELVRALGVLTAFGRARKQGDVVRRVSEQHRRTTMATLRIAFLSALVLELLASLSVAVVAVGIGLRLAGGDLDLATGLMVLVLAPEVYLPLRSVGSAHHASEDGVEAVRRVDEALRDEPAEHRGGTTPPPREAAPLEVRDLRVLRRAGSAPDGVGFTARPGEVLRLDGFDGLGPSGSGKSTTLSVLLGFTRADEGEVRYGGTALDELDPAAWRQRVAWVPQRPAFSGGTVAEELALAVSDQPPGTGEAAGTALAEIGAAALLHRPVDRLSTGERQRVAVARALLRLRGHARVLLLDEPTANLDVDAARRVDAAVHRAARAGHVVVLASHRPEEPAPAADAADGGTREIAGESDVDGPRARRVRRLLTPRAFAGIALGALSLLSGLALTATSAWLIARASQQPPIMALTVAVVGVRTFALSRAVLRYVERVVSHDAAFRLSGRLREQLWHALVRLGPARTAGLRRGEGLRRLVDDVDAIRDLVPRVLLPPAVGGVVLLGAVAVQAAVLPAAGWWLAGGGITAAVAGPLVALAAERRATAAAAAGRRSVAARVFALFDGIAEHVAFGADARQRRELAAADALLTRRSRRAAFGSGAATAVQTLAIGVAVLGGVWTGAAAVSSGALAPELAPVLGLVPLAAAEAVGLFPPAAQQASALRAAQRRVAPVLAAAEECAEQRCAPQPAESVELRGVTARWPGAAEPALRDVHLRIPAGTHVAVVGPSGGGKSTLVALLLGHLVPEGGAVAAPPRLSWCPQEPQLVSTTVRENLRVADPEASDARLGRALRLAGLAGWSEHLDAVVGADGLAVSGGEARRLALARALLDEEAALVLLDEPTAHVDTGTADSVVTCLRRALRDRTVVHVTHRWAEAEHADVVLRVADGQVAVLRDLIGTGTGVAPGHDPHRSAPAALT